MIEALRDKNVLAASFKLAKYPFLKDILGAKEILSPLNFSKAEAVIGWGLSPRTQLFRKLNKPFITLEDGFLRSVGLGKMGAPALSIIYDDEGIYYDTSKPSRFPHLLSEGKSSDIGKLYNSLRLTKYNAQEDRRPRDFIGNLKQKILIIDQVKGDRSLKNVSDDVFIAMAIEARERYPQASLFLKTHPDVLAGKAKGILTPLFKKLGLTLLEDNVSPHALFDEVEEVFTVTSQLGFEAMLRGVKVSIFGEPFYKNALNIDILAHTALAEYPLYFDPVFGNKLTPQQGLERLARWRDDALGRKATYHAIGFSKWKHGYTRKILTSPFTSIEFKTYKQVLKSDEKITPLVWGKKISEHQRHALIEKHGVSATMEDGFIRSKGLGSNFIAPLSLVIDKQGIYFDAIKTSDFEIIAENFKLTPEQDARAVALKELLISSRITKYNLKAEDFKCETPFHLVVGQVEDDASIKFGAGDIKTNAALLKAVRLRFPSETIVYKEHPDVASGNRKGKLPIDAYKYADFIVHDGDSIALIEQCEAIHTITSLAGFEALMRGKKTYVYGFPFYGHYGLTEDLYPHSRKANKLSLNALIYITYINYPRYTDAATGVPLTSEEAIYLLNKHSFNLSHAINAHLTPINRGFKYLIKSLLNINLKRL